MVVRSRTTIQSRIGYRTRAERTSLCGTCSNSRRPSFGAFRPSFEAEASSPTGAPNRTAEIGHRDKHANRLKSSLNRPVSGSVSADLNHQHPANSRAFPDPSCDPSEKSLHPEPRWRWGGVAGQRVSWGRIPAWQGKYWKILRNQIPVAERRSRLPSLFAAVASYSL